MIVKALMKPELANILSSKSGRDLMRKAMSKQIVIQAFGRLFKTRIGR